jgi:hypothetical protein
MDRFMKIRVSAEDKTVFDAAAAYRYRNGPEPISSGRLRPMLRSSGVPIFISFEAAFGLAKERALKKAP